MFFQQKFRILSFLIVISFIGLLINIYNLQILDRENSIISVNQQTLDIVYLPSPRGEIYDVNNIKLASSSLQPHLFLNLRKINDNNQDTYEQYLRYNFPNLETKFIKELFEKNELLVKVINIQELDFDDRQSLSSLDAFEIFDFPIRLYEYENIASHVIGYLGEPSLEDAQTFPLSLNVNIVGKSGLERYYENDLSGEPTQIIFKGSEIEKIVEGSSGKDIKTSLNINLQMIATESLLQGMDLANDKFESREEIRKGAVVVINIQTNEVVSMVSLPDYNPNNFVEGISNREFNEIGWFYCSGSSDDIDRYVTYNYLENVWSIGELSRTAWLDEGIFNNPLATHGSENSSILYNQEDGSDADGSPMDNVFIESGDIDIDEGNQFGFISRIIPDVKFFGSTPTSGQINYVLKTRNYPGESLTVNSTNNVTSTTDQNFVRARARQMVFRVQSDDDANVGVRTGFKWRLGANRFDIRTDGRR